MCIIALYERFSVGGSQFSIYIWFSIRVFKKKIGCVAMWTLDFGWITASNEMKN